MKKSLSIKFLRITAMAVLLAGAGCSLGLMFYTGRNNDSVPLLIVFAMWVLSPFTALLAASVASKNWPAPSRAGLYSLMLVIPLGSLVCYSGLWSPPGTKPAFVYLIIPLVSWLLLGIVIPIAVLRSRRQKK